MDSLPKQSFNPSDMIKRFSSLCCWLRFGEEVACDSGTGRLGCFTATSTNELNASWPGGYDGCGEVDLLFWGVLEFVLCRWITPAKCKHGVNENAHEAR